MTYLMLLLVIVNVFVFGVALPWMVSYPDSFLVLLSPFVALTTLVLDLLFINLIKKGVGV